MQRRNNHCIAFEIPSASIESYSNCSFFGQTIRDWNGFLDSPSSSAVDCPSSLQLCELGPNYPQPDLPVKIMLFAVLQVDLLCNSDSDVCPISLHIR